MINDQISVGESLAAVRRGEHISTYHRRQMLKLRADLARYELLIRATQPTAIVETGTHEGASSAWFATRPGVRIVVTLDVRRPTAHLGPGVVGVFGKSSTSPRSVRVPRLVAGHRVMVVLDSDHSARHVRSEIETYASLVTPGCALVVEDGLFDHADLDTLIEQGMPEIAESGGPYRAIVDRLHDDREWSRAENLGVGSSLSQNIDGWWIRGD
jgi:cephalosporin hydroxylase